MLLKNNPEPFQGIAVQSKAIANNIGLIFNMPGPPVT
jgi:hypothetical protein